MILYQKNIYSIHDGYHFFIMNRLAGFVRLDSFYSGIRGCFQTHFVLEKTTSRHERLHLDCAKGLWASDGFMSNQA